jgi:hypothetical protein
MGQRVYSVPIDNVSIGTAVQDIFSLLASASNGIEIHHIHLAAAGVTSPAEVRLRLKRGTATVTQGSGGSAPTPAITDVGDTKAAQSTAHINDTTQATTSGAFTTLLADQWNVLLPFDYLPAPEDREVCTVSQALILDLPAVLAAAYTISGFIKFRELP